MRSNSSQVCGWHSSTPHSLTKTFGFVNNTDLGSFLAELFSRVHDQPFNIQAVESAITHELTVSITDISSKYTQLSDDSSMIPTLVGFIERLYSESISQADNVTEKHRRVIWHW